MKKLILFFLIFSLLISCKNNNGAKGTVKTNDEKSNQILKCLEGLAKHDTTYAIELTVDTLKFYTGVKPEGKKEWIKSFSPDTSLLKNYRLDKNLLNIETQYNNNGEVFTHVWTNLFVTGGYSKTEYTIPVHMEFKWMNTKIEIVKQYYDKTFINNELAESRDIYNSGIYSKDIYNNDVYNKDDYNTPVKKIDKKKKK